MVGELLREAVDVEAAHAGDVLAQVLAARAAGAAGAAGERGIRHDVIARREAGDALADRDDLARRLGADGQREVPLGEGHAAKAPHVDVVQPDIADAQLHLARSQGGGGFDFAQGDLTVGQQLQRANAHCRRRADHQSDILAAEAEGVGHRMRHAGVARDIRHAIHGQRRVGRVVVDRRRQPAVPQRQRG